MTGTPDAPLALVTGATGFIGRYLAERLLAEGTRVRILARDPRRWHGPPLEVVQGGLDDPAALRRAAAGADEVYHVAGLIKATDESEYQRVNHLGTLALLEACRSEAAGLRRFVLVSSQAAAGPAPGGRAVRECDPPRPVSPYGLSKLKAERSAEAFGAQFPVTIVRPPVVYGPRDRETLLIFRVARYGLVPRIAAMRAFSIVHVDDLVRGILLAARAEQAVGRTYFLSNGAASSVRQVCTTIAAEFRARPIEIPLPALPLVAAAGVLELVGRVTGVPVSLTRNKVREATQVAWVCDPGRAAAELGWRAEIPVEAGVRDTARWYRERGWL